MSIAFEDMGGGGVGGFLPGGGGGGFSFPNSGGGIPIGGGIFINPVTGLPVLPGANNNLPGKTGIPQIDGTNGTTPASQQGNGSVPNWLLQYLPLLLGGATTALGAILQGRETGARNESLINYADLFNLLGGGGADKATAIHDVLSPALQQIIQSGGITPQLQELWGRGMGFADSLPGMYGNTNLDPATGNALSGLAGIIGSGGEISGAANELLGHRGATPDTRALLEAWLRPQQGVGEMAHVGEEMLQNRGHNGLIDQYGSLANSVMSAGGYNPQLMDASALAKQIAANGGRTPESSQALQDVLNLVRGGGENDTTRRLAAAGLGLAERNPLMPLGQKLSMSRDQASREIKGQAEAALRRAAARGGSGAVISGLGNDDMAQFADSAAGLLSDNLRGTLADHEKAALSQQGLGASMATDSGKLAADRLASGIGGLSNLERITGDRQVAALNTIGGLDKAATDKAGTYGGLGMNAEQLALARLLGGNTLVGNAAGINQAGYQGAGNVIGQEMANLFNSGNMLNNLMGTQIGGYNAYGNLGLGQGQLNLGRANGQSSTYSDMLKNGLGVTSQGIGNQNTAFGNLGNLGQNYLGYSADMYRNIPVLISAQGYNPALPMITQGGMGILAGGLPNIWNTGGRSGRGGNAGAPPAGGDGGYG